jgi:hypothetical protein
MIAGFEELHVLIFVVTIPKEPIQTVKAGDSSADYGHV